MRLALTVLLASAVGSLACSERPPALPQTCPCAAAQVCCDSGNCAPDQTSCAATDAARFAEVAGVWDGHCEDFTFPSGSDAIKITLSAPPGATPAATIVWGAPQVRPPIDPEVGWPAEAPADLIPLRSGFEGFPYEAQALRWEASRLKFTLSRWSPWLPWCEAQTPYPSETRGHACVAAEPLTNEPDADGNCLVSTTPPTPVPCGKAFPLCYGTPPVCTCDASGCGLTDITRVSFDLALRDGVGTGSADISTSPDVVTTMRLTQTTR